MIPYNGIRGGVRHPRGKLILPFFPLLFAHMILIICLFMFDFTFDLFFFLLDINIFFYTDDLNFNDTT